MANLSWISSNPDYINQMIRNTQVTLSNNYNDLDNIPIIKITSTTNNPQKVWGLKEGLYMIDGVVQVDNNTSYEVSNLLISMTARLENGKYILSAFIPYLRGLFEYILKTNSTEYEQHQKIVLMIKNDTLALDNETIYTPIEDYHPATKKYVDDKANEIVAELDKMGVNKENLESLNKENRIRDIKLQALLSETSDRNITIEENVRYFDMPLSIDNGIVTINEIIGETLVNVCDQEESVAITKSYTVENENHIPLQGEYDGSCRPVVHGNTLVNHNADWDDSLQTGVETNASGIEDVQVEGIKGQEVSVVVEGNTVLNHALGKTSAVVSSVEDNLLDVFNGNAIDAFVENNIKTVTYINDEFPYSNLTSDILKNIKPNTVYTIFVNVLENTMTSGHYILVNGEENGFTNNLAKITPGQLGKLAFLVTSKSEIPSVPTMRGYMIDTSIGDKIVFEKPLILEGDHTTNPKYVNSNEGNYVDLTVANDMSSVVEIEGRTMVNVCDQKDPIAITKSYTVENSGNHIALQGEYDGSCRPVIQGNTMVNLSAIRDKIDTNRTKLIPMVYDFTLGKTYTIIFDLDKDIEDSMHFCVGSWTGQGVTTLVNPTKGRHIVTNVAVEYNTSNFRQGVGVWCDMVQNTGVHDYTLSNIMIFEGDLTQTPELIPTEYVEGLKSSFEDGYIPENVINIDDIYVYGATNDTGLYFIHNLEQVLQVGKTYTLSYNIDDTTTCENGVIFRLTYNNSSSTYISIDEGNLKGRIGKKIRTFTVPDDFDNSLSSKFEFWNRNSDTIISISNISFLEGDWTHLTEEDFNHLGKYKVEYKVTGKNKWRTDLIESFKMTEGEYYCDAGYCFKELCPDLIEGCQYKISYSYDMTDYNNQNGMIGIALIPFLNISYEYFTYTKDMGDMLVYFYGGNLYNTFTNIQIEEGTVATSYEPYKEYTKTFYLNSPLLEGDTIEDVSGVATHVKRYGKVVLDGSSDEGWTSTYKENSVGVKYFQLSANFPIGVSSSLPYCDKLQTLKGNQNSLTTSGQFIINQNKEFSDSCYISTNLTTYADFSNWLQANPTTVVYKLASPIYEPISNESILCDSYVNGHLDVDTNIPIEKVVFKGVDLNLKYIQPSAKYIIQFESDNAGKLDMLYCNDVLITDQPIIKGLNKFTVTLPSTILYSVLAIQGIGFNASNIVATEAIDVDFEYFGGLSSTYESCYPGGKNLFDGELESGYWDISTGEAQVSNNNIRSKNFVKVKYPFTISSNINKDLWVLYYDKDYKLLGNAFNNQSSYKNTEYIKFYYVGANDINSERIQIEEGSTATSYEPFIDKYKVDVKVTGKNKLHTELTLGSSINTNNGSTMSISSTHGTVDYIEMKPDTEYTISKQNGEGTLSIVMYTKEKTFIKATWSSTFTTPSNCYYVRFCDSDIQAYNYQLEEGTVATSYEPYFESTKTFYLNSPLLEGDKIVTKNGKVYHYHKMGMVVFDGSENWSKNNIETPDNFESFYNLNSDFNKLANGKLFTDTIKILTVSEWNAQNVVGIYSGGKNSFGVLLNSTKPSVYFKTNPTTVVYELDTPYYELIDEYNNTILNIPKNVAHLTHTSAVPVNNTVFNNYKDELNVLEANTQYRVMFDCNKANIPFTVTLGGTSQTVTSKIGTHSLLITTPSTLVDKNLVIDGIGRCGIDNIRIFKGNVEYDYVKGLWSGYEERRLKNLSEVNYIEASKVSNNHNWNALNLDNLINGYIYTFIATKTPYHTRLLIYEGNGMGGLLLAGYSDNEKVIKSFKKTNTMNYIGISTNNPGTETYYAKDILILEGDWTDNPPTYEEVMANEGKYAVKVKLDTNATIFGKGGRL